MEVPQVAQQPDLGPVADAGQEGIHQNDAFHFPGVLRGVGVGDHQANVMTDDFDLVVAERLHQRMNILGEGLLVVAAIRLGRRACATQVGRNDRLPVAQVGHQWSPHMAGLCIAV